MSRLLESLKRGEKAEFMVRAEMLNNRDEEEDSFVDEVIVKKFESYDPKKDLYL